MRQVRRYDPQRRSRLIRAALEVMTEQGLAAVTHRKVAHAADVPSGSISYHFSSLQNLLEEALTLFVEQEAKDLEHRLGQASGQATVCVALANYLYEGDLDNRRPAVLLLDLEVAATRSQTLSSVWRAAMTARRAVLEKYFDPVTACELGTLLSGLVVQQSLASAPLTEGEILHAIKCVTQSI